MTDEDYINTKKRLEILLEKWHPLLQMGFYNLRYFYVRGYCPNEEDTCALTTTQWVYRKAHITWYINKLFELEDSQLENVVIHELAHVILAPVTQDQDKEWEEQVEFVTETVAILFENIEKAKTEEFYAGPDKPKAEFIEETSNGELRHKGSDSPVKPD